MNQATSLGTAELSTATEQILLRAIEQCERGETIPMANLLGELRARE